MSCDTRGKGREREYALITITVGEARTQTRTHRRVAPYESARQHGIAELADNNGIYCSARNIAELTLIIERKLCFGGTKRNVFVWGRTFPGGLIRGTARASLDKHLCCMLVLQGLKVWLYWCRWWFNILRKGESQTENERKEEGVRAGEVLPRRNVRGTSRATHRGVLVLIRQKAEKT